MPFRSGDKKRRRRDFEDFGECSGCKEEIDFDDMWYCGACDKVFCQDCLYMECDICKAKGERNEDFGMSSIICEGCVPYPQCDACENLTICVNCLTNHLDTCTSKPSAPERMLSIAKRKVLDQEIKTAEVKQANITAATPSSIAAFQGAILVERPLGTKDHNGKEYSNDGHNCSNDNNHEVDR